MKSSALFLLPMVGCSGPAFTNDAVSEQTPNTAPAATTALYTGTSVLAAPDGDAADAADGNTVEGPMTPCGTLRGAGTDPSGSGEVCLEGGTFSMGSNQPNLGSGFSDHTPAHEVFVSPFVLDAYEVTRERYAKCVEAGACTIPQGRSTQGCTWEGLDPLLPITCVTWEQAERFCSWDGGRRLPTEAEWEFSARNGGTASTYPWGDDFGCHRAVLGAGTTCPEFAGSVPHPAGTMLAGCTSAGIHDLAGNVAEWVYDWAGSYSSGAARDPSGPPVGASRLLRGGSWTSSPTAGYSYARVSVPPDSMGPWGFRCARSAAP